MNGIAKPSVFINGKEVENIEKFWIFLTKQDGHGDTFLYEIHINTEGDKDGTAADDANLVLDNMLKDMQPLVTEHGRLTLDSYAESLRREVARLAAELAKREAGA